MVIRRVRLTDSFHRPGATRPVWSWGWAVYCRAPHWIENRDLVGPKMGVLIWTSPTWEDARDIAYAHLWTHRS